MSNLVKNRVLARMRLVCFEAALLSQLGLSVPEPLRNASLLFDVAQVEMTTQSVSYLLRYVPDQDVESADLVLNLTVKQFIPKRVDGVLSSAPSSGSSSSAPEESETVASPREEGQTLVSQGFGFVLCSLIIGVIAISTGRREMVLKIAGPSLFLGVVWILKGVYQSATNQRTAEIHPLARILGIILLAVVGLVVFTGGAMLLSGLDHSQPPKNVEINSTLSMRRLQYQQKQFNDKVKKIKLPDFPPFPPAPPNPFSIDWSTLKRPQGEQIREGRSNLP